MTRRRVGLLLAIGAYVGLRLYAFLGASITSTPGTFVYTGIADHSVFAVDAARPPVVPLFAEIVGTHTAWAWTRG